jgi:hypothetical protein
MINLIDRFRESIIDLSDSASAQLVIIHACIEVTGHDMGFLCILVDILVRRGVLKSASLSSYVCSKEVLSDLSQNIHIFTLGEISIDRSLDVLHALISRRNLLVGKGLKMDSEGTGVDSSAKDYSGAVTHILSMGKVANEGEAENVEVGGKRSREDTASGDDEPNEDSENIDEDENRERGRRRINEAGDQVATDKAADGVTDPAETAEQPDSELVSIEEALADNFSDCRKIYSTFAVSLMEGLSQRYKDLGISETAASSAEDEDTLAALLDPWFMTAFSLLRKVLRNYHAAQNNFSQTENADSRVCDPSSVEFEISSVALPPQIASLWSKFSTKVVS